MAKGKISLDAGNARLRLQLLEAGVLEMEALVGSAGKRLDNQERAILIMQTELRRWENRPWWKRLLGW